MVLWSKSITFLKLRSAEGMKEVWEILVVVCSFVEGGKGGSSGTQGSGSCAVTVSATVGSVAVGGVEVGHPDGTWFQAISPPPWMYLSLPGLLQDPCLGSLPFAEDTQMTGQRAFLFSVFCNYWLILAVSSWRKCPGPDCALLKYSRQCTRYHREMTGCERITRARFEGRAPNRLASPEIHYHCDQHWALIALPFRDQQNCSVPYKVQVTEIRGLRSYNHAHYACPMLSTSSNPVMHQCRT